MLQIRALVRERCGKWQASFFGQPPSFSSDQIFTARMKVGGGQVRYLGSSGIRHAEGAGLGLETREPAKRKT